MQAEDKNEVTVEFRSTDEYKEYKRYNLWSWALLVVSIFIYPLTAKLTNSENSALGATIVLAVVFLFITAKSIQIALKIGVWDQKKRNLFLNNRRNRDST